MLRKCLVPIACAILFLPTAARGGDFVGVEAILKLEDQRFKAMVAGDVATLDRILADDLTYVHSNGQLETKAEFLARLKSGELKYKAMPRTDVKVSMLGCAAVVTGKVEADVESKGQRLSFPMRFTDVYLKKNDGNWQMVAWQSSRIQ